MHPPIVLDFDRSIQSLPGARFIPLSEWQDRIRYGCSLDHLNALDRLLDQYRLDLPATTFLGSGDFHHLSYLLIRRLEGQGPFQVIVFDNHPDNMRYPWGIHCGSWVHHVCRLPFVTRVTVIGITSDDIGWRHLWENHLTHLYSGKLFYYPFSPVSRWVGLLGLSAIRPFREDDGRLSDFIRGDLLKSDSHPVYLSIDKDVLSPEAVITNWDQGILKEDILMESVQALKPHLLSADVTGEISFHAYQKRWKRILSGWDGQSAAPPPDLASLQGAQSAINQKLVALLSS
jgi:hypothetical protein